MKTARLEIEVVSETYIALIRQAIRHAEVVLEHQPGIDFDSVMLHVESNYPELEPDEEDAVRAALRERHYPGVSPGAYMLEIVAPA